MHSRMALQRCMDDTPLIRIHWLKDVPSAGLYDLVRNPIGKRCKRLLAFCTVVFRVNRHLCIRAVQAVHNKAGQVLHRV